MRELTRWSEESKSQGKRPSVPLPSLARGTFPILRFTEHGGLGQIPLFRLPRLPGPSAAR